MSLSACQKCGKPVLPHRACKACGFYRGREAVNTTRDVSRLLKKTQTKTSVAPKAAAHDHEGHEHA